MNDKRTSPTGREQDGAASSGVAPHLNSAQANAELANAAERLDVAPRALEDLWRGLSSDAIVVRLAMVTRGLELSLGAAADDDSRRMAIDVARGRLAVGASLADLERAVHLALQEQAREHGAVVKSVALRLKGGHPRQVELFLTVTAKQGFLSASVEIKGRVTIDDTFHARLSGVDVRGQGFLGGLVATWMRPHLKRIEQSPYHVSSVLPGSLEIQDVRLEVGERLQLVALLGGSNFLLDKPQGDAAGDVTGAKKSRPAPAATGRGAARKLPRKFDIFIVDAGGNPRAREVLDSHLVLFQSFLAQQNLHVLTPVQSESLLKRHPHLVGADPILLVVDAECSGERREKEYGFRFCLGTLSQDEECGRVLDAMLRSLAHESDVALGREARGDEAASAESPLAEALQVVVDVVELAALRR